MALEQKREIQELRMESRLLQTRAEERDDYKRQQERDSLALREHERKYDVALEDNVRYKTQVLCVRACVRVRA